MIGKMSLVLNKVFIFLFITLSYTFGQDSTYSNASIINYSTASRFHLANTVTYHFNYSSLDRFKKSEIEKANQPKFINDNISMVDGTTWKTNSDINYLRLSSMIGLMGVTNAVAYIYQRNVWYTEQTTVFHSLDFFNDWNKYQQMDKFGHFTDAYFTSDLTGKIYRWSGMSGNTSVWVGALTGWAWMLEIELSDAFMSEWGFSWGDMLANTAGSAFYVLQQFNYDALGGIHPKFSWHKSDAWKENRYHKIRRH